MLGHRIARLGKVAQIAYVVTDIHAQMSYWSGTLGVGPFFVSQHLPLKNIRYRGEPSQVDMSAAIAYWGDVQIELIMQHNRAPSTFRDWIDGGKAGVHHFGVFVDSLAHAVDTLSGAGGELVHEHEFPGAASAAYVEMPGECPVIEAIEMSADLHAAFAKMNDIAKTWDGSDPIRYGLP